jgi:outer membrane protein OmpA-like peptidoglycan-associated protein
MRTSLQGRDAQTLAPQPFAEAEQALARAKAADKAGDALAAELHAEHAVAAYQHAIALARLARATEEETASSAALARAVEEAQRYAAARKAAEREADDLDKQLKIAREAERPGASGPVDPERERARLVAAQSLVVQARLLCSAARLVSAQAPGLAEAENAVADLEKKLDAAPKPAPIDAAGRARAGCLTALTKARRAGAEGSDQADALLGELSRAADPKAKTTLDLAPTRDERGVVVTLRSIFKGDRLSPEGETALKDLGRIASAHPSFGVQVVLHDASAASADTSLAKRRGETIAKALADGGASPAKTKVEHAGARAPVVDPSDAARRDRNARVEVVFVTGS